MKQMANWEAIDTQRAATEAELEEMLRDLEARTVYPDAIVQFGGRRKIGWPSSGRT